MGESCLPKEIMPPSMLHQKEGTKLPKNCGLSLRSASEAMPYNSKGLDRMWHLLSEIKEGDWTGVANHPTEYLRPLLCDNFGRKPRKGLLNMQNLSFLIMSKQEFSFLTQEYTNMKQDPLKSQWKQGQHPNQVPWFSCWTSEAAPHSGGFL